jgi:hypothetical protein
MKLAHWHSYSDHIEAARTKTLRKLLETDARIVGFTIEDDGVFIYTNSDEWCSSGGGGTWRADTETGAVRDFLGDVYKREDMK